MCRMSIYLHGRQCHCVKHRLNGIVLSSTYLPVKIIPDVFCVAYSRHFPCLRGPHGTLYSQVPLGSCQPRHKRENVRLPSSFAEGPPQASVASALPGAKCRVDVVLGDL